MNIKKYIGLLIVLLCGLSSNLFSADISISIKKDLSNTNLNIYYFTNGLDLEAKSFQIKDGFTCCFDFIDNSAKVIDGRNINLISFVGNQYPNTVDYFDIYLPYSNIIWPRIEISTNGGENILWLSEYETLLQFKYASNQWRSVSTSFATNFISMIFDRSNYVTTPQYCDWGNGNDTTLTAYAVTNMHGANQFWFQNVSIKDIWIFDKAFDRQYLHMLSLKDKTSFNLNKKIELTCHHMDSIYWNYIQYSTDLIHWTTLTTPIDYDGVNDPVVTLPFFMDNIMSYFRIKSVVKINLFENNDYMNVDDDGFSINQ